MSTLERKWLTTGTLAVKLDGAVSAVFATTWPQEPDRDGDVYAKGAIRAADRIPVSAWNHGSSLTGGALPVGVASVRTTAREAVADVAYFLDLPAGREAFEVVRRLAPSEWSWTLDIRDAAVVTLPDGRRAREIRDVVPLEVSPVYKAAGLGTRTLTVDGDDVVPADVRALAARLRDDAAASDLALREYVRYLRTQLETLERTA